MIRLGLAGASSEMLVKFVKWLYSEAQDWEGYVRPAHWYSERAPKVLGKGG